jgi:hypothetical protein
MPWASQGKGKGQEKQAQALQKQLQHEQDKHMERVARLNRIRELALKKGDTETVARVDKLIAKEQEVYTRKQAKMQGQPRPHLRRAEQRPPDHGRTERRIGAKRQGQASRSERAEEGGSQAGRGEEVMRTPDDYKVIGAFVLRTHVTVRG